MTSAGLMKTQITPLFWPRSANAHAGIGHRLDGDWVRARYDVDTVGDLRLVWSVGSGAHTMAALDEKPSFFAGDEPDSQRSAAVSSGTAETRSPS